MALIRPKNVSNVSACHTLQYLEQFTCETTCMSDMNGDGNGCERWRIEG
jgi:hypothetical protein